MPFFDEAGGRRPMRPSQNETAQRWQKKVAALDGFIVIAAEYNRGPTAVLKNALDYAYNEWNSKPVAFVGYGGVGGARAIEQLRLHAVELQMAPIRAAVHIVWGDMVAARAGQEDRRVRASATRRGRHARPTRLVDQGAEQGRAKAEAEEAEILAA